MILIKTQKEWDAWVEDRRRWDSGFRPDAERLPVLVFWEHMLDGCEDTYVSYETLTTSDVAKYLRKMTK